jgi:hypothetical protein
MIELVEVLGPTMAIMVASISVVAFIGFATIRMFRTPYSYSTQMSKEEKDFLIRSLAAQESMKATQESLARDLAAIRQSVNMLSETMIRHLENHNR